MSFYLEDPHHTPRTSFQHCLPPGHHRPTQRLTHPTVIRPLVWIGLAVLKNLKRGVAQKSEMRGYTKIWNTSLLFPHQGFHPNFTIFHLPHNNIWWIDDSFILGSWSSLKTTLPSPVVV
jgi:hypothetical protein